MNTYEEKRALRVERLKARAARLSRAAGAAHERAQSIADRIPMGQPILVGHHSQARHERDIARIQAGFDRSMKLAVEAKSVQRRADSAEANRSISSDDPEAVDKLRLKLAKLDADRAKMVAANKAARAKDPRAALVALGFSATAIDKLLAPDFAGRLGFADYVLRNSAGEASRLRKRIAELEAKASTPAPPSVASGDARIEEIDNRVRIYFADRPDSARIGALKASGFRWAPSVGAWQRHASPGAWYAARQLLGIAERGAA